MSTAHELADTASIRAFMTAMNQNVRDLPTADVPEAERILRGKLVIEEALELLEALGLQVRTRGGVKVDRADIVVLDDPSLTLDLVEVAKESADLTYVNKGAMLTFGLPADEVFAEVHTSNMSKLGADNKPVYREDGKVTKGPNYRPADVASIIKPLIAGDAQL